MNNDNIVDLRDERWKRWAKTFVDLHESEGVRSAIGFFRDVVGIENKEEFTQYVKDERIRRMERGSGQKSK